MRKLKVIIFDDEVMILHMLNRWFSQKGYEVLTFNEPAVCPIYEKKTVNCSKENKCADIIITDFKMPRMNGIELLQHQSQRGCTLDIKNKAVMSAYMSDKNKMVIKNIGCSFFEKPLELSLLSDWTNECEKRTDLSLPLGSL